MSLERTSEFSTSDSMREESNSVDPTQVSKDLTEKQQQNIMRIEEWIKEFRHLPASEIILPNGNFAVFTPEIGYDDIRGQYVPAYMITPDMMIELMTGRENPTALGLIKNLSSEDTTQLLEYITTALDYQKQYEMRGKLIRSLKVGDRIIRFAANEDFGKEEIEAIEHKLGRLDYEAEVKEDDEAMQVFMEQLPLLYPHIARVKMLPNGEPSTIILPSEVIELDATSIAKGGVITFRNKDGSPVTKFPPKLIQKLHNDAHNEMERRKLDYDFLRELRKGDITAIEGETQIEDKTYSWCFSEVLFKNWEPENVENLVSLLELHEGITKADAKHSKRMDKLKKQAKNLVIKEPTGEEANRILSLKENTPKILGYFKRNKTD